MLVEELRVQVGKLDCILDGLDLVVEAADVGIGDVGHLFQQRFGSRFIETDEHYLEAFRYIAFNPVRAGLCERPTDWRWSSFFGATDAVFYM